MNLNKTKSICIHIQLATNDTWTLCVTLWTTAFSGGRVLRVTGQMKGGDGAGGGDGDASTISGDVV